MAYSQAKEAYKSKDFNKAGELVDQALKQKKLATVPKLYWAAQTWAQAGRVDNAFRYLNATVRAGFDDLTQLQSDSLLRPLHPDRRWPRLLATVAKMDAALDQPLKKELAEIHRADQNIRIKIREEEKKSGPVSPAVEALEAQMDKVDEQCMAQVLAILDRQGWPSTQLVGREGLHTIYLVIQHAPPSVQRKYLPMLQASAKRGELEWSSVALTEDRVLSGLGKPQVYGSQVRLNKETKKYELYPIEDEARVDERRAAIGLEPLATYAKRYGISYKPTK